MLKPVWRTLSMLDRKDRLRLWALAGVMLAGVVLEAAGIGLILPFVRLLAEPAAVHRHPVLQTLFELSGADGDVHFLILTTIALFLIILTKNVVVGFGVYYRARITQELRSSFSQRLFRFYLRAPYAFHLNRDSAELTRNLFQSVSSMFGMTLSGFLELATESLVVAAILAVMLAATPGATLTVMAVAVLVFAAFHIGLRRWTDDIGHRTSDKTRALFKLLGEAFGAFKEIVVLGRQGHFEERFNAVDRDLTNVSIGVQTMSGVPRLVVETIAVAALLLGTLVILADGKPTGQAVALIGLMGMAAVRLMPSLSRIIQATNNIRMGARFVDDVHADYQTMLNGKLDIRTPRAMTECLVMDGIGYSYPTASGPALTGISLRLDKGDSLAVVGSSGAGKSTLADLVLGLLRPTEGRLVVDGRAIGPEEVIGGIAYVPQSIFILDDSLRRNIALGMADREIDEARVLSALKRAQLDELAENLPDGLDTLMGERGLRLSGGQRQRVGIARALYHDPDILVLDEATAALDVETERRFTDTIHALSGEKTLIIIAHRLSTVRECHRIALMEEGRLVDVAPFQKLCRRNDRFRHLVELAELRPAHDLPDAIDDDGAVKP